MWIDSAHTVIVESASLYNLVLLICMPNAKSNTCVTLEPVYNRFHLKRDLLHCSQNSDMHGSEKM